LDGAKSVFEINSPAFVLGTMTGERDDIPFRRKTPD
jgi:hypothetical protein